MLLLFLKGFAGDVATFVPFYGPVLVLSRVIVLIGIQGIDRELVRSARLWIQWRKTPSDRGSKPVDPTHC